MSKTGSAESFQSLLKTCGVGLGSQPQSTECAGAIHEQRPTATLANRPRASAPAQKAGAAKPAATTLEAPHAAPASETLETVDPALPAVSAIKAKQSARGNAPAPAASAAPMAVTEQKTARKTHHPASKVISPPPQSTPAVERPQVEQFSVPIVYGAARPIRNRPTSNASASSPQPRGSANFAHADKPAGGNSAINSKPKDSLPALAKASPAQPPRSLKPAQVMGLPAEPGLLRAQPRVVSALAQTVIPESTPVGDAVNETPTATPAKNSPSQTARQRTVAPNTARSFAPVQPEANGSAMSRGEQPPVSTDHAPQRAAVLFEHVTSNSARAATPTQPGYATEPQRDNVNHNSAPVKPRSAPPMQTATARSAAGSVAQPSRQTTAPSALNTLQGTSQETQSTSSAKPQIQSAASTGNNRNATTAQPAAQNTAPNTFSTTRPAPANPEQKPVATTSARPRQDVHAQQSGEPRSRSAAQTPSATAREIETYWQSKLRSTDGFLKSTPQARAETLLHPEQVRGKNAAPETQIRVPNFRTASGVKTPTPQKNGVGETLQPVPRVSNPKAEISRQQTSAFDAALPLNSRFAATETAGFMRKSAPAPAKPVPRGELSSTSAPVAASRNASPAANAVRVDDHGHSESGHNPVQLGVNPAPAATRRASFWGVPLRQPSYTAALSAASMNNRLFAPPLKPLERRTDPVLPLLPRATFANAPRRSDVTEPQATKPNSEAIEKKSGSPIARTSDFPPALSANAARHAEQPVQTERHVPNAAIGAQRHEDLRVPAAAKTVESQVRDPQPATDSQPHPVRVSARPMALQRPESVKIPLETQAAAVRIAREPLSADVQPERQSAGISQAATRFPTSERAFTPRNNAAHMKSIPDSLAQPASHSEARAVPDPAPARMESSTSRFPQADRQPSQAQPSPRSSTIVSFASRINGETAATVQALPSAAIVKPEAAKPASVPAKNARTPEAEARPEPQTSLTHKPHRAPLIANADVRQPMQREDASATRPAPNHTAAQQMTDRSPLSGPQTLFAASEQTAARTRMTAEHVRELQTLVARALDAMRPFGEAGNTTTFVWKNDQMGSLRFRIAAGKETVAIDIESGRADVVRAIDDGRIAVERMIADLGLRVERFEVRIAREDAVFDQPPQNFEQRSSERNPHSARPGTPRSPVHDDSERRNLPGSRRPLVANHEWVA